MFSLTDLPLHPALVHLPLGLAAVVPLAALAALLTAARRQPAALAALAAAQALVLLGAVAAGRTGEDAEEAAEAQGVPEAALEAHEEAAELFTGLSAATLGAFAIAAALALAGRRGAPAALALGGMLSLGVAGQGLRVGHAGGVLVYQHGAGVAAAGAVTPGAAHPAGAAEAGEDGDDD